LARHLVLAVLCASCGLAAAMRRAAHHGHVHLQPPHEEPGRPGASSWALVHSKLQVIRPLEGGPWTLTFCSEGFGSLQKPGSTSLPVDDILQIVLVLDEAGEQLVQGVEGEALTPFNVYMSAHTDIWLHIPLFGKVHALHASLFTRHNAGAYVWWDLQDVLGASGMQNSYSRGGKQLTRHIIDTWASWLKLAESCNLVGPHLRKARPTAHKTRQQDPDGTRVLDEHAASTFGMLVVFLRTATRSRMDDRMPAQQFMQELLAFFSKEPVEMAIFYDRQASASPVAGCRGSNERLLTCHAGMLSAAELWPLGPDGHMLHSLRQCMPPDLRGSCSITLSRVLVAALESDTMWLLMQLITTCGHLIESAVKDGHGDWIVHGTLHGALPLMRPHKRTSTQIMDAVVGKAPPKKQCSAASRGELSAHAAHDAALAGTTKRDAQSSMLLRYQAASKAAFGHGGSLAISSDGSSYGGKNWSHTCVVDPRTHMLTWCPPQAFSKKKTPRPKQC
jgi:hypothetical protein